MSEMEWDDELWSDFKKDKKKMAIEQVFKELSMLSNEEFWDEVNQHKDTFRAMAIEYAMNPTKDNDSLGNMEYSAFKYERRGILYYFTHIEHFKTAMGGVPTERSLMIFADTVVDIRINEILKCRYPLEYVIDTFYSRGQ